MTFWSIVISIFSGLGIGMLILYFKNTDYSNVFIINAKDFRENMRKGQLIDVRKKEAFEKDKIKGARHFTPAKAKSKSVRLRKDLSVYIYCENGKTSRRVAKKLSKNGFIDLYVLEKGFENYKNN